MPKARLARTASAKSIGTLGTTSGKTMDNTMSNDAATTNGLRRPIRSLPACDDAGDEGG